LLARRVIQCHQVRAVSEPLVVAHLVIPEAELRWTAVRASGPGGQNVNKVSSKIDLRFAFEHCAVLSEDLKARLRASAGSRLDGEGRIQIISQLTRNQADNLTDAREKLAELLLAATITPKRRRKTKPSRRKRAARVADKRVHSAKKQSRGRVAAD
jgi:ribosome-associated protein